jgi:alanine-synthesizing transaminase
VTIPQAERIGRLTYAIRNIAVAANRLEAEGRRVLYLNIGDPLLYDFETPPQLVEAVVRAMRDGKNYYAPSYGVTAAREAISASLEREGVWVPPGDAFVTSGASEAIEVALTAMLEPGDNVLTPCPGYPLYSAVLCKLGAEERSYRLDGDFGWRPDVEHLESLADARTRAIVIINPNNPTGAVWDEPTLLALLEVARRRNLVVLADEVYHTMTYRPRPPRIASLAGDVPVIAFDSLSKSYLATGWRVGWMSLHGEALLGELKGAIGRLLDARLCSPTPPQFAIPVALEGERAHVAEALARLRVRRDAAVDRLGRIPGITCVVPEGAFYLMARFEHLGGRTDESFVLDLLESENVLVVHGSGFGLQATDGYMRIVYLPPVPVLDAALEGLDRVARRWMTEVLV